MRAINHALSGAVIGLVVTQPAVALPLAVASHFVLDAVPHHGNGDGWLSKRSFKLALLADGLLCVLLVAWLARLGPQRWWLAAVCAFLAAAPDLMWVGRAMRAWNPHKLRTSQTRGHLSLRRSVSNLIMRIHKRLQWFEHPIGALVEAAWFVAMVVLLLPFLRSAW